MTLKTIELETGPNPTASVVLMHGLGADGNDFVPIVSELDLRSVGPVRFVFPNAPRRPVSINNDYLMPAWYDIKHDRTDEDAAGLRASQAAIEELIQREKDRGIASHRIVVAGFSQGCAMALLTGLRHPQRLGGILAMSGYLPLADTTEAERQPANINIPIFMAHGRQDPVVYLDRARGSRDALRALGYAVEWHDYPMAHSVCIEEIADINTWLVRVLG